MRLSLSLLIICIFISSCINPATEQSGSGDAQNAQLISSDVVHAAESIIPHAVADEILQEILSENDEVLEVKDEEKIQKCIMTESQLFIFQSVGGEVKFKKIESMEEGMLFAHLWIVLDEEALLEKLKEICSLESIEEMEALFESSHVEKIEKLEGEVRLVISLEGDDKREELEESVDRLEKIAERGDIKGAARLMDSISRKIVKIQKRSDKENAIKTMLEEIQDREKLLDNIESNLLLAENKNFEDKTGLTDKISGSDDESKDIEKTRLSLKKIKDEIAERLETIEDDRSKLVKLQRIEIRQRAKLGRKSNKKTDSDFRKKLVEIKRKKRAIKKENEDIDLKLEKNLKMLEEAKKNRTEFALEHKKLQDVFKDGKKVQLSILSEILTQTSQEQALITEKEKNNYKNTQKKILEIRKELLKGKINNKNILALKENIKKSQDLMKLKPKLSKQVFRSRLYKLLKIRREILRTENDSLVNSNGSQAPVLKDARQNKKRALRKKAQEQREAISKDEDVETPETQQQGTLDKRDETEDVDDRMEVIRTHRIACEQYIPKCAPGFIAQDVRQNKSEGCAIYECIGDLDEGDDFEFGLEDQDRGLDCREELERKRALMRCPADTMPRIVNFKGCEIKCL